MASLHNVELAFSPNKNYLHVSYSELFDSCRKWIFRDLSRFSLDRSTNNARIVELLKPLGELTLAASLLSKLPHLSTDQTWKTILDFSWSQLREGNLLVDVLKERPDLLVMLSLYATLYREGYNNKILNEQLAVLVHTPGYYHTDMLAWRRLDLLFGIKDLEIGLDKDSEIADAFDRTWLSKCHSPWTITEPAAYGLTHTAFYMTNYGFGTSRLPSNVEKYLLENCLPWTRMYLQDRNFDLAAEMIMSRCCIKMPLSDSEKLLSGDFLNARMDDGALPCPPYGALSLLFGENDPSRRHFLLHYHTVLVTCMASAMAMNRGAP